MKHKTVYNLFQINMIVFYTTCLMLVPMLMVIAYIFDLQTVTSINYIILIADIIAIIFFVVGLVYLLLTRDKFERRLKPSYTREFTAILTISGFGILGIGILFIYLGGLIFYVPHVIIPLFLAVYFLLFIVGEKYFNVNLLEK